MNHWKKLGFLHLRLLEEVLFAFQSFILNYLQILKEEWNPTNVRIFLNFALFEREVKSECNWKYWNHHLNFSLKLPIHKRCDSMTSNFYFCIGAMEWSWMTSFTDSYMTQVVGTAEIPVATVAGAPAATDVAQEVTAAAVGTAAAVAWTWLQTAAATTCPPRPQASWAAHRDQSRSSG